MESEDNVFVLTHMSGKIIYFELEQHASVCGSRSWQRDWSGTGKTEIDKQMLMQEKTKQNTRKGENER